MPRPTTTPAETGRAGRWRHYALLALKITVTGALVAVFIRLVDWHHAAAAVRAAVPHLLALYAALIVIGILCSAMKWHSLGTTRNFVASRTQYLRWYYTGTFLNHFLPGVIGGDFYRAVRLGRHGGGIRSALLTVFADRLTGFYVLLWIAALAGVVAWLQTATPWAAAIALTALPAVLLASVAFIFRQRLLRLFDFLPPRIHRILGRVDAYAPRTLLRPLLLGVVFTFLGVIAANYVLFLSFGVRLPALPFVAVITAISIIAAIPVTIGNWGTKELAYVYFFGLLGVPSGTAAAVALVGRVIQMILSSGAVGLYWYDERSGRDVPTRPSFLPPARRLLVLTAAIIVVTGGTFFWTYRETTRIRAEILRDAPRAYDAVPGWVTRAQAERAAESDPLYQSKLAKVRDDAAARAALNETLTPYERRMVAQYDGPPIAVAPPAPPGAGESVRIGYVSDIQLYGSKKMIPGSDLRVIRDKYRLPMRDMFERMTVFRPHILVTNGDTIEGTNRTPDVAVREMAAAERFFARADVPTYWVVGNHELRGIDKSLYREELGLASAHLSFLLGDYKIIIADSNYDIQGRHVFPGNMHTPGNIAARELLWLEQELRTTPADKIPVVFMHHPPLSQTRARPAGALPSSGADEARRLFAHYGVLAVFAGHVEQLYRATHDGVQYFVSPGVVKSSFFPETFWEITLTGRTVAVTMSWTDPATRKRMTREITAEDYIDVSGRPDASTAAAADPSGADDMTGTAVPE